MATKGERQALLFLAAVAMLGAGTRWFRAQGATVNPGGLDRATRRGGAAAGWRGTPDAAAEKSHRAVAIPRYDGANRPRSGGDGRDRAAARDRTGAGAPNRRGSRCQRRLWLPARARSGQGHRAGDAQTPRLVDDLQRSRGARCAQGRRRWPVIARTATRRIATAMMITRESWPRRRVAASVPRHISGIRRCRRISLYPRRGLHGTFHS